MSENREKYTKAFIESFSLDPTIDVSTLEFQGIPEWDSVGHMTLVATIEDTFEISLETDDIVDFSSYSKGKEILSKYSISID
jgi:acyl carrier protein